MKLIFLCLLIVLSAGCKNVNKNSTSQQAESTGQSSSNSDQIKLAELKSWPANLVVEIFYHAGMDDYSNQGMIGKDSCTNLIHNNGKDSHYSFIATQAELDKLLQLLNSYHTDNMHTEKHEGTIYDSPANELTIRMNGKKIELNSNATEEVKGKNKNDFMSCFDAVNDFINQHIQLKKKNSTS